MRSKEDRNAYMRDYMRRRYATLRAEIIKRLGCECAKCGGTDRLEIDHKDRSAKKISFGIITSISREKIEAELPKCQLLCYTCHKAKTKSELTVGHGGGLSGMKNCPCGPCKARKSEYNKMYRKYGRVTEWPKGPDS